MNQTPIALLVEILLVVFLVWLVLHLVAVI